MADKSTKTEDSRHEGEFRKVTRGHPKRDVTHTSSASSGPKTSVFPPSKPMPRTTNNAATMTTAVVKESKSSTSPNVS